MPPLLEGVADNVAPGADLGLFPDMERAESAQLAPSRAWLSPSRAFSSSTTRRPPCACSVSRGKPSASRAGRAVSTLIRKVSGLRRYRPGRFVGEAATTNAGSLARMWRCIFRPCVRGRHGAPAGCFPRCGPWRRRCRPPRITRKASERRPGRGHRSGKRLATGACSSADAQEAGVREVSALTPHVARALNPASARRYPAWPCSARFERASCSPARLSPSRF